MDIFGLSNIQIDGWMRRLCDRYQGTFSCNNIPFSLCNKTGSLIVNLAPWGSVGTHFISILLDHDCVYYIDSLGGKCENSDIKEFLIACNRPVYYQEIAMQSSDSAYCGFYSMLIVTTYEMEKKWTNPFNEKNDKIEKNDAKCLVLLSRNMYMLRNRKMDP